jgi:hypothetical protein
VLKRIYASRSECHPQMPCSTQLSRSVMSTLREFCYDTEVERWANLSIFVMNPLTLVASVLSPVIWLTAGPRHSSGG